MTAGNSTVIIIIPVDNSRDYHHLQILRTHNELSTRKCVRLLIRQTIFSESCSSNYSSKMSFADIANETTLVQSKNILALNIGKGVLNRSTHRTFIGHKIDFNRAE